VSLDTKISGVNLSYKYLALIAIIALAGTLLAQSSSTKKAAAPAGGPTKVMAPRPPMVCSTGTSRSAPARRPKRAARFQ